MVFSQSSLSFCKDSRLINLKELNIYPMYIDYMMLYKQDIVEYIKYETQTPLTSVVSHSIPTVAEGDEVPVSPVYASVPQSCAAMPPENSHTRTPVCV